MIWSFGSSDTRWIDIRYRPDTILAIVVLSLYLNSLLSRANITNNFDIVVTVIS